MSDQQQTDAVENSSSKCYVATCQRPTAVTHTVTGHFTSETDLNLIVAKCTTLEIHTIGAEGLSPVLDANVYGRISVLKLIRMPNRKTDSLFVCTEDYQYFVLGYNPKTRKLVTTAKGENIQRIGRPCENGQIGFTDSKNRMIGLHLFEGSIKVIPISKNGSIQESFDLKIEELQVISITFLEGCDQPTIAVLYQERQDDRHVKTYVINTKEKEVEAGPWTQNIIEAGANLLVPVSGAEGAVLIVGESTISFKSKRNSTSIPMAQSTISCFSKVDSNRYLMGKRSKGEGGLMMLFMETDDAGRVKLKLEHLGGINVPTTLAYIDDGVVFVGCEYGDSQLVKLLANQDAASNSFVETLETYSNIGPILDFCVVDLEKQGQSQVVTCSGAYRNGSIRVVRNGIGINEFAELDMAGIQGIWSLFETDSSLHKILALSLVGQTAFLLVDGEDLDGITIDGASDLESLHISNVADGCWLQVVHTGVYLVDSTTKQLVAKWNPPNDKRISACACSNTQLVLAMGAQLTYLSIQRSGLTITSELTMEHEIACLDISTSGTTDAASLYCLVGLWTDISLRVLRLSDLQQVDKHLLGGEIVPRDAKIVNFGDAVYAFCSLGDGSLWTYVMDSTTGSLNPYKKVRLGTKPISLSTMAYDGNVHLFASSDQPTIVYLSNGKLVFSNVNLSDVKKVCPLNTKPFPDCLAVVSSRGLMIGNIDEIQKLQIKSVPLKDAPYRIVHQESSSSFLVVLHTDHSSPEDVDDIELGKLLLLNHSTLDATDQYILKKQEMPMCAVSFNADDTTEMYCVGTGIIDESEDEPSKGRILVFKVVEAKLHLVCAQDVKGCVYSLLNFNTGKIVAGVNSMVQMFSWEGPNKLSHECGHHGYIIVMTLKSRGDYVLVGDLMRSCTLLRYSESKFEEVASDGNNAFWIVSQEMFDEENFICAEDAYNFFTCKRNSDAMTEEQRQNLITSGEYHVGSYVNCIRTGTLATKAHESESKKMQDSLIFATQTGVLGVVIPIDDDLFQILSKVSERLIQVLSSVGDLSHTKWRAFKNNKRCTDSSLGFIDGDLIESYLDLDTQLMNEVVSKITVTTSQGEQQLTSKELLTRIEALGRLH